MGSGVAVRTAAYRCPSMFMAGSPEQCFRQSVTLSSMTILVNCVSEPSPKVCGAGRALIHGLLSPIGQGGAHGMLLTPLSYPRPYALPLLSSTLQSRTRVSSKKVSRGLVVRESQKTPNRIWEAWGGRWSTIQRHLHETRWCLRRTDHWSCGWN